MLPDPTTEPICTSSAPGAAVAATLDSTTAQALWLEKHLADVINALWRLLGHDLDRVLRGAADGALRAIREQQQRQEGGEKVDVDAAARVLHIMGTIFQASFRFDCLSGWGTLVCVWLPATVGLMLSVTGCGFANMTAGNLSWLHRLSAIPAVALMYVLFSADRQSPVASSKTDIRATARMVLSLQGHIHSRS